MFVRFHEQISKKIYFKNFWWKTTISSWNNWHYEGLQISFYVLLMLLLWLSLFFFSVFFLMLQCKNVKNLFIIKSWFFIRKLCMWCDCFLSLVCLLISNAFAWFFKWILHFNLTCWICPEKVENSSGVSFIY